jgi:hypothetical protein
MGKNTAENIGSGWPSPGVLLLCAALVAAGYGMAVLRGPAPAQEVRVLIVPTPTPAPETAPSPE